MRFDGCTIVGLGLIVMVNVFVGPLQFAPSFVRGVTTIVAVIGVDPVLIPAKDGMSPVPLAASPIDVVLLVQV
jgi:hypothetical protein